MDDLTVYHEVSRFLYREARLLDEARFDEWLDLWSDDALYLWPTSWASSVEGRIEAAEGQLHHLRSNKQMLGLRVSKLVSGTAWAEVPPSRTVRTVTNIEIDQCGEELEVLSNILLHRVRYTDEVEVHAAARSDRLRLREGVLSITRRRVRMAQSVVRSENMEFFI